MKFEQKVIPQDIIKDLIVIEPEVFVDRRGQNFEGYSQVYNDIFKKHSEEWRKKEPPFVTDSFSHSRYSVIRGFHGDTRAWKLIQCLAGEIHFAVIDMRYESPTFKKIYIDTLSAENRRQVLVPSGCVNAHQCLSNECVFSYKLTHGYVEPSEQIHVRYDSIDWPIKESILSARDRLGGKIL